MNINVININVVKYFNHKLSLSFGVSILSKLLSLLLTVISYPLILSSLGKDNFSILMMIASLFAISNFSDLGIGLSLQYLLPKYILIKNERRITSIISTALFFLIIIGLFLIFFGVSIVNQFDLRYILGVKSFIELDVFNKTLTLFFIFIGVSIPITLVQRVQSAFKETYTVDLYNAASNFISIILIFIVVEKDPSIINFLFCIQGLSVIMSIVNFSYYFLIKNKHFINFRIVNKYLIIHLVKFGGKYFFLLVMTIFMFSFDSFILTRFNLLEVVSVYLVGFKLAFIFNLPVNLFSAIYIGYFNTHLISKNIYQLNKVKIILFVIGVFSVFEALVFYFCGTWIINLWFSGGVVVSTFNLLIFSLLVIFSNFNSLISLLSLNQIFLNRSVVYFPLSIGFAFLFKFIFLYFNLDPIAAVICPSIFFITIIFLIPSVTSVFKYL